MATPSTTYEEFRAGLLSRHRAPLTDHLSILGEVIMLTGVGMATTRRWRHGATALATGFGVAAGAHLFQPGTLTDELMAITRHPLWSVRAETHRIVAKVSGGGTDSRD
jgi:hypothetical protein